MIDAIFQSELLKRVEVLAPELQHRVLDFATNLASTTPKGTPGSELLRFSGCITEEDAQLMIKAIEEGCEQVDHGQW
jgi:hypothetical protein